VETVPERLDDVPEPVKIASLDAVGQAATTIDEPVAAPARVRTGTPVRTRTRVLTRTPIRPRPRARTSSVAREELLWVVVIYLATRGLLLLTAYLNATFAHHNFLHELANWDGLWYRKLADQGYPTFASHRQTTLGFFPLFPITIWGLGSFLQLLFNHNEIWTATVAGVVISMTGGLIATTLVYRLAAGWFNGESARRATILFCVFPGSVVFSMVYSEGILLPLAAGCIYALQRRRWLLAGILAGLGTAVQPAGLVLVLICAVSAVAELRRRGWSLTRARPALVAPVLSITGISAFAVFLWFWTGTPLANYEAQHHGWSEKTNLLAMVHLTTKLFGEISFSHLNEPTINLNLVLGLIGTVLLLGMLVMMFRSRHAVSIEAIVWTLGISFLALTSEDVPPNPRMLITAFPALIVAGHYIKGKWFRGLVWANVLLLILLSSLTFYGTTLRP
jgi:Gpi18-like mannosyltransferase